MPRAVVIDESALSRRGFTALLEAASYDVVTARSAREGIKLAAKLDPNLVTYDEAVSDLDTESFLAELFKDRWRPVALITDPENPDGEIRRRARGLGIAATIPKPAPRELVRDEALAANVLKALNRACTTRRPAGFVARAPSTAPGLSSDGQDSAGKTPDAPQRTVVAGSRFPIFLVGSSTGGPKALQKILPELPGQFPGAIVIAQHMPKSYTAAFANRISKYMAIPAQEVESRTEIRPGNCYIAEGGSDCVFSAQRGKYFVCPVKPREDSLFCPSVDRLVETAMRVVPIARLRGVQLTGIGKDGADMMAELKSRGAPVLAESEESCVVFGMPGRLIELGGATKVLHNKDIAAEIVALI